MLLFVGLGNPGVKYAGNRHNIGFMAIEEIARAHGFAPFRTRFQARVAEGQIAGERVILVAPQTYMNESGRSVAQAQNFYKVGLSDITVLHDELDLPPGKCRVKTGGGAAGHNGLRSIAQQCGADFRRVRLGIGHPGDKALVHSYVLNDFAKSEQGWVRALCEIVARHADALARGDDSGFQNKVHLAMEAAGFAAPKRVGEKSAE